MVRNKFICSDCKRMINTCKRKYSSKDYRPLCIACFKKENKAIDKLNEDLPTKLKKLPIFDLFHKRKIDLSEDETKFLENKYSGNITNTK